MRYLNRYGRWSNPKAQRLQGQQPLRDGSTFSASAYQYEEAPLPSVEDISFRLRLSTTDAY